jgi:hypothetical protein
MQQSVPRLGSCPASVWGACVAAPRGGSGQTATCSQPPCSPDTQPAAAGDTDDKDVAGLWCAAARSRERCSGVCIALGVLRCQRCAGEGQARPPLRGTHGGRAPRSRRLSSHHARLSSRLPDSRCGGGGRQRAPTPVAAARAPLCAGSDAAARPPPAATVPPVAARRAPCLPLRLPGRGAAYIAAAADLFAHDRAPLVSPSSRASLSAAHARGTVCWHPAEAHRRSEELAGIARRTPGTPWMR